MKRVATALVLGTLVSVSVHGHPLQGQGSPRPATFEAADVHVSPKSANTGNGRFMGPRDGLYKVRQATVADLVRVAYGVEADKVTGGPAWLEYDRFDITAKVPSGTNRETVKPMLQALLADRFKLVVRPEQKSFPRQALVVAGTPKLKEATGSVPGTCNQSVDAPSGPAVRPTITLVMGCKATSMATFAERLTSLVGGVAVSDATGLQGLWDFEFRFSPNLDTGGALAAQDIQKQIAKGITDSIEKSLGLKLEARSITLPTVFVDSVNRAPAPNPPGTEAAFPAAAAEPEFEVADIKPSVSDRTTRQVLPTGQFTATGVNMRLLLTMAFPLDDPQQIVSQKSLEGAKYDVIAKVSSRPIDPADVDQEELGAMMRKLLTDRLRLKTHREERVIEAPTLVASGQHRLVKVTDPNSRTKCTQSTTSRANGSAAGIVFQLTCQNMTLAEFAERLQRADSGAYKAPFLDDTHIEGRWDIAVDFTPAQLLQILSQAQSSARASAASAGVTLPDTGAADPGGGMTLPQALDKQLGLKVEMRKRPVSVLVVDGYDDKPSDN